MPLDPAFRSRLREAIQQSVKRDPARTAVPAPAADAPIREEPRDEPIDAPYDDDGASAPGPAAPGPAATGPVATGASAPGRDAWIADTLGGWWQREGHGVCLVVDREHHADGRHGDRQIGHHAETLARYQQSLGRVQSPLPLVDDGLEAATFGEAAPGARDRFLFFDLETTGLSGGAGTCAFLIGFGWFEGEHFRTRQYFLSGYGHEPAMLRMAADALRARQAGAGDLAVAAQNAIAAPGPSPVCAAQDAIAAQDFSPAHRLVLTTFNGRTFDLPLIGNRYLLHRLASPFDCVPHLDLLHPARRLWRYRPSASPGGRDREDGLGYGVRVTGRPSARPFARTSRFDFAASAASCALGELELAILGVRRTGDVPGAEIPARYFHYVRTGDVRPLEPVLAHNRYDLLSLAALTGVVAHMLEEGPQAARNAHECVALGRLYERSGAADRAADCYEKAVKGDLAADADPAVQREALRRLACRHRRDARHDEAAAAWHRLLDLSVSHGEPDVEALHALAVHHEHRLKNFDLARTYVQRLFALTADPRLQEALRHRLQRIERKRGGLSSP
jgi:hypothetical protein